MKTEIKLKLSNEQFNNLLELISNSTDTGNKEWDSSILNIKKQLENPPFTLEDKLFIENKKAELKKMEQTTHENADLIGSFIEHCEREGVDIPATLFESFFGA